MDDFYSHVNKKWLNDFTLPDDHVRYTSFDYVNHIVKERLLDILNDERKKGTTLGKMSSKLDQVTYLSQFDNYFALIDNVRSIDDYIRACGTFSFFGTNPFFSINVARDLKHSNDHILCFSQINCTLPAKSYYDSYKEEYLHFLELFLNACAIQCDHSEIYELDKRIALLGMNIEEKRDIESLYNIVQWSDFISMFSFDVEQYFHMHKFVSQMKVDKIMIDNLDYIKQICDLIVDTDIELLKCYLKYKFILTFPSIILPSNISSMMFRFFKKQLLGVEKEKSKDEMMISYITMFMPEMLGQLYADKYFNDETREYICNMIELIKLSTKNIISDCYWMSDHTKEKSKEKVDLMNVKVGNPLTIRDYTEFSQFVENDPIEMTMSCSIFYGKDNLLKLGTKVDRNKWSMASYAVNAYYSPLNNEIVIPAGILQCPFFSKDNDLPTNMGSIGSVIAHEISHGFDDQGRMFDADGNYNSWWSKTDVKKYNNIIKNFKNQYNSISIMGNKVSGDATIGENIADFTGMLILTNILKINGSPDKDFATMYTAYAVLWRQKIRDKEMIKRLKTDVHAPPRLRTNVILSNIPDFIRVFNIGTEHKMYVSEVKRFKLWF